MKAARIILVSFLLVLISFAASAQAETNPEDIEAVKQTIKTYVQSTDARNADQLEKVLYDNCNFISYNEITHKTSEMADGSFLDLVKDGKAGGWTRNLNINSVDVNDNMAVAKVEISDSKVKETGFLTLIKNNGSWKIMNGVSTLETN